MEDFINEILGDDTEIFRTVDFDDFTFVFYRPKGYSNPYKDEKLNLVSSYGPLKINKKTNEHEFTNIVEFFLEYGDNKVIFPNQEKSAPDWNEVIYNIKMRNNFNWEDFQLLLEHYNLPLDSFDMYSINSRDTVEIEIKHEEVIHYLEQFLNELEAIYIKKSHNHFLINLYLD
nr:hypothetical protein [Flavobacterium sp. ASV13]